MPEETKKASEELVNVGETVGADIDFDDKGEPVKQEEVVEETIEVEQVPAEDKSFENERETKLEKKDEVQEYSEGVQKRIAKLTRKMREAERQREEAIAFAEAANRQKSDLEGRLSKLDKNYVSEFENRVTTSMAAAKLALKNAIESQDVEAQIAAQEQLANLTVESARVNALKAREVAAPKEKEVNVTPQQQQPTQQSDPKALEALIDKIINDNREKAIEYKQGKEKLFGFFVGQAMKVSGGKANPQLINEILKKKL